MKFDLNEELKNTLEKDFPECKPVDPAFLIYKTDDSYIVIDTDGDIDWYCKKELSENTIINLSKAESCSALIHLLKLKEEDQEIRYGLAYLSGLCARFALLDDDLSNSLFSLIKELIEEIKNRK